MDSNKNMFQHFDKDGDGTLNIRELEDILEWIKRSKKQKYWLRRGLGAAIVGMLVFILIMGIMTASIIEATKEIEVDGAQLRSKTTNRLVETAIPSSYVELLSLGSLPPEALDSVDQLTFTVEDGRVMTYNKAGVTFNEHVLGGIEVHLNVNGYSLRIDNDTVCLFVKNGVTSRVVTDTYMEEYNVDLAANDNETNDDETGLAVRRLTGRHHPKHPAVAAARADGRCSASGTCAHTFPEMMVMHGFDGSIDTPTHSDITSRRRLAESDVGINYARLIGVDAQTVMSGNAMLEQTDALLESMLGGPSEDILSPLQHFELQYTFKDSCSNYMHLSRCGIPVPMSPDGNVESLQMETPYYGTVPVEGFWYFEDIVKYEKDKETMKITITYGHDRFSSTRNHVIMMSADGMRYLEYDELFDGVDVQHTNCATIPPSVVPNPIGRRRLQAHAPLPGDERLTQHEVTFHRLVRQKLAGFGHVHVQLQDEHAHMNTGVGIERRNQAPVKRRHLFGEDDVVDLAFEAELNAANEEMMQADIELEVPEMSGHGFVCFKPGEEELGQLLNESTSAFNTTGACFATESESVNADFRAPSSILGEPKLTVVDGLIKWPSVGQCVVRPGYSPIAERARMDDGFGVDDEDNQGRRLSEGQQDSIAHTTEGGRRLAEDLAEHMQKLSAVSKVLQKPDMFEQPPSPAFADKMNGNDKPSNGSSSSRQLLFVGAAWDFYTFGLGKAAAETMKTTCHYYSRWDMDTESHLANLFWPSKLGLADLDWSWAKTGILFAPTWNEVGFPAAKSDDCKGMRNTLITKMYQDFDGMIRTGAMKKIDTATTIIGVSIEVLQQLEESARTISAAMDLLDLPLGLMGKVPYAGPFITAFKVLLKSTNTAVMKPFKTNMQTINYKIKTTSVEKTVCSLSFNNYRIAYQTIQVSNFLNLAVRQLLTVDNICKEVSGEGARKTNNVIQGTCKDLNTVFQPIAVAVQSFASSIQTASSAINKFADVVKKGVNFANSKLWEVLKSFFGKIAKGLQPMMDVLERRMCYPIPRVTLVERTTCALVSFPCGQHTCTKSVKVPCARCKTCSRKIAGRRRRWKCPGSRDQTISYPCGVKMCTRTECVSVNVPVVTSVYRCFSVADIINGALSLVDLILDKLMELVEQIVPPLPSLAFNIPAIPDFNLDLPNFGIPPIPRLLSSLVGMDHAASFEYLGCYANMGEDRVNGHINGMTYESCQEKAKVGGYFGLEWPEGFATDGETSCLLLPGPPAMTKVLDSYCEYEDSNGRKLGGANHLALYGPADLVTNAQASILCDASNIKSLTRLNSISAFSKRLLG